MCIVGSRGALPQAGRWHQWKNDEKPRRLLTTLPEPSNLMPGPRPARTRRLPPRALGAPAAPRRKAATPIAPTARGCTSLQPKLFLCPYSYLHPPSWVLSCNTTRVKVTILYLNSNMWFYTRFPLTYFNKSLIF